MTNRKRKRPHIRTPLSLGVALAFLGALLIASPPNQALGRQHAPTRFQMHVSRAVVAGVSRPLRKLPPAPRVTAARRTDLKVSRTAAGSAITSGLNFEGMYSDPHQSGNIGTGDPPDPNGTAGPNRYVETVNGGIAIWDKSGTLVLAPKDLDALWAGYVGVNAGNDCSISTDGDPLAVYDRIADRFIISQMSLPNPDNGPNYLCIAVSKTSDPAGAYYLYDFQYNGTPDYPKMSVWPDAYYETANLFYGDDDFEGPIACAYDRAAMLTGAPAQQVCFNLGATAASVLAATIDGPRLPPAGTPDYLLDLGTDSEGSVTGNSLDAWTFHVDWGNTAASAISGPSVISVPQFSIPCASADPGFCIPEPSPGQPLDSLGDRLMYRLAYRNFGDHQSLVVTHSIAGAGTTAIRWYELRPNSSGALSLFQSGTYSPDGLSRWMGSAAMDAVGDIGLGYSTSSATAMPGIRYTGRLATDPAGTMTQPETTVITGTGVETGDPRWGDYSAMSVDPSDDCTFWYVNEYYATTGEYLWHTRISTFRFPACESRTVTITLKASGVFGTTPSLSSIQPNNPAITVSPASERDLLHGALNCSTTAGPSSPVSPNPYPISKCSGLSDPGWTISYAYGNSGYTVTRATPSLNWSAPAAIVYGTALSNAQLDAATGVPGTFAYLPPGGTVLGAGKGQTLSATFTPADTNDYVSGGTVGTTIDVSPAPLQIRAANLTVHYGAIAAKPRAVFSGFVNGDTPPSLQQLPNCAAAVTTDSGHHVRSHPGVYPVTCSGAASSNYTISYVAGKMTVERAVPKLAWATPASIVYGTALSSRQLDATSNTAGNLVYHPIPGAILHSGHQKLTVSFKPADPQDYLSTVSRSVILHVTQASAVVRAARARAVYGSPLPKLTFTLSGLVNGDTTHSLTSPPVCHTTAAVDTSGNVTGPAGSYPITCSGAASQDYSFHYRPGTLVVALAPTHVLILGPAVIHPGKNTTVSVALKSLKGTPIAGRRIQISAAGHSCTSVTRATGTGTCVLPPIHSKATRLTVTASFAGDPSGAHHDYAGSHAQATVKFQ